jgi:hypothetical protein
MDGFDDEERIVFQPTGDLVTGGVGVSDDRDVPRSQAKRIPIFGSDVPKCIDE